MPTGSLEAVDDPHDRVGVLGEGTQDRARGVVGVDAGGVDDLRPAGVRDDDVLGDAAEARRCAAAGERVPQRRLADAEPADDHDAPGCP
jgi:hypothetical protein